MGRGDRKIVDLRIMRHGDERGIGIERAVAQHVLRPVGNEVDALETLAGRKGGARIDDRQVETGDLCHRRQRLADMDRASDDDARRRHMHGQEELALRRLLHATFA